MSSDQRRELLFIGRPVPEKGLADLLAALRQVVDVPWRLTIAGEMPELPDAVDSARVHCLGRVPRDQVPELMQRHDVLVVPSRYETFGNVALEGLAVAMVVVAARTGGLKALITSGWNGFLFTPADRQDLAATLAFVLAKLADLGTLRRRARVKALSYSWEAVTAATAEVLDRLRL